MPQVSQPYEVLFQKVWSSLWYWLHNICQSMFHLCSKTVSKFLIGLAANSVFRWRSLQNSPFLRYDWWNWITNMCGWVSRRQKCRYEWQIYVFHLQLFSLHEILIQRILAIQEMILWGANNCQGQKNWKAAMFFSKNTGSWADEWEEAFTATHKSKTHVSQNPRQLVEYCPAKSAIELPPLFHVGPHFNYFRAITA